jgi:hypothetical protein
MLKHRKTEALAFMKEGLVFQHLKRRDPLGIACDDISEQGPRQIMAFKNHRSRTTIEQYYWVNYTVTLDYPHLPCIVEAHPKKHANYYPIEVLKFLPLEK